MAANTAFDLSMLETAVPKREHKPVPQPEIVPKKVKSNRQLRREAIASALGAAKILVVTVLVFAFLGGLIGSKVKLVLAQREGEELQKQITAAQTENSRLTMALDNMVSGENIEDYAVNKLGMKKLERYQIHYLESTGSDEAVVHDGLDE